MAEDKFKKSCLRFKQSLYNEKRKGRKTIFLNTPVEKAIITSIVKLPKLNLQPLVSTQKAKSDILATLVHDLELDQEEGFEPNTRSPQDLASTQKAKSDILATLVHDLELDQEEEFKPNNQIICQVLSSIEPIAPGKRTRFRRVYDSVAVQIYLRCSLDVWLIFRKEKFIFPKPRNDIAVEAFHD